MKLPNAENAVVEREKITEYLLNESHRYGANKARFFGAFGFRTEDWVTFAEALREHSQIHDVKKVRETGFGRRYEVKAGCALQTGGTHAFAPSGNWIKEQLRHGSLQSYPTEKTDD